MLLLGLLIGATGACTGGSGGGGGEVCTAGRGNGTIDGPIGYRSTGGFSGKGDGTPELSIYVDGTITRENAGGGTESAVLPPPVLDDLRGKILDVGFGLLAPVYDCPGCGDDYVYVVSVQLDGRLYSVMASELAPPPSCLTTVIDTLREIGRLPLDWH